MYESTPLAKDKLVMGKGKLFVPDVLLRVNHWLFSGCLNLEYLPPSLVNLGSSLWCYHCHQENMFSD